MERTKLKEISTRLADFDGKTVTVCGWAKTIRDSKAFGFIELNDAARLKTRRSFSSAQTSRITTKWRIKTWARRSW